MNVITSILRGWLVRKYFIISHIVAIDIIAVRSANDRWAGPQITGQSRDRDVNHVITEATAIRPATGNRAAAEAGLNRAGKCVPAEDTQP